jgi:hypothetical protein
MTCRTNTSIGAYLSKKFKLNILTVINFAHIVFSKARAPTRQKETNLAVIESSRCFVTSLWDIKSIVYAEAVDITCRWFSIEVDIFNVIHNSSLK